MTDAPALTLSPQQRAADVLRRRRELRTEAQRRGAELRREATRAAAEDETRMAEKEARRLAEMRARHGGRPDYLEFLRAETRKRGWVARVQARADANLYLVQMGIPPLPELKR